MSLPEVVLVVCALHLVYSLHRGLTRLDEQRKWASYVIVDAVAILITLFGTIMGGRIIE